NLFAKSALNQLAARLLPKHFNHHRLVPGRCYSHELPQAGVGCTEVGGCECDGVVSVIQSRDTVQNCEARGWMSMKGGSDRSLETDRIHPVQGLKGTLGGHVHLG